MKSFYKTVAILALVLVILGLILTTAAAASGGIALLRARGGAIQGILNWAEREYNDYAHIEPPIPQQEAFADTEQVRSLDLELGAGEFVICTGETFSIASDKGSLAGISNSIENGEWKITAGFESHIITPDLGRVVITLPEGVVLEELELELGAGEVTVEGLQARRAEVAVGAGRVQLTDCVLENADFACGMGEVSYTGSLTGHCGVECAMGSTSLWIDGLDEAEFGFSVECGAGNVQILQQTYSGLGTQLTHDAHLDNFFEIECGMGNVTLQAA